MAEKELFNFKNVEDFFDESKINKKHPLRINKGGR